MGGGAGGPSPLPTAPALCAPCQQPGNATATRGSLAGAGVPKECSFGARQAKPAGESHAAGVRFPTAPWCPCVSDQARLAGALDLRLPVSQGKPLQGQGPVRIRAVPVPAQPQPAAFPSAAERSWVAPCQAVKGSVSCCRGHRHSQLGMEMQCWERAWHTDLSGCSRAGVRAFLEMPGRSQWDVQALHHQDNWQPHKRGTQMPRGCRVCSLCQPLALAGLAGLCRRPRQTEDASSAQ